MPYSLAALFHGSRALTDLLVTGRAIPDPSIRIHYAEILFRPGSLLVPSHVLGFSAQQLPPPGKPVSPRLQPWGGWAWRLPRFLRLSTCKDFARLNLVLVYLLAVLSLPTDPPGNDQHLVYVYDKKRCSYGPRTRY